jgi:hypothetical protein
MNFPQATPGDVAHVEKTTRFGICAFVDLLGFAERVLAAKTAQDVANVRTGLDKAREQFEFKPRNQMTQQTQAMYDKRVYAVSDSVITFVPRDSEAALHVGDFDTFFSELTTLVSAQAWLVVNEGIFVRGAVDLGWWFEEPDTIISDALVRAYKLETRANVPVIAVGARLYDFFFNHEARQTYAEAIEPVARLLRLYEGTYRDQYGEHELSFYFLDYLLVCLSELDWRRDAYDQARYQSTASEDERQRMMDEGYNANVRDWLRMHADRIREGHAMAPSSARGKYEWLADYHNSVARQYEPGGALDCVLV